MSNLSALTKSEWEANEIRIHFADCLFEGFAWIDCIAFAAFPDFEVQKKFLTHELSELMTPRSTVERKLVRAGLDPEITHTVVDMIAYFSVKDFIMKPVYPHPERRGIRPSASYYPAVEDLYPLFERYAQDSSSCNSFETLVQAVLTLVQAVLTLVQAVLTLVQVVLRLKGLQSVKLTQSA